MKKDQLKWTIMVAQNKVISIGIIVVKVTYVKVQWTKGILLRVIIYFIIDVFW